jgi:hypothetical protein
VVGRLVKKIGKRQQAETIHKTIKNNTKQEQA